jgi:hypothetical protein
MIKKRNDLNKNTTKIGISIDNEINDKLDKNNYNKSKLINSLLLDWLNHDNNVEMFKKKSE